MLKVCVISLLALALTCSCRSNYRPNEYDLYETRSCTNERDKHAELIVKSCQLYDNAIMIEAELISRGMPVKLELMPDWMESIDEGSIYLLSHLVKCQRELFISLVDIWQYTMDARPFLRNTGEMQLRDLRDILLYYHLTYQLSQAYSREQLLSSNAFSTINAINSEYYYDAIRIFETYYSTIPQRSTSWEKGIVQDISIEERVSKCEQVLIWFNIHKDQLLWDAGRDKFFIHGELSSPFRWK